MKEEINKLNEFITSLGVITSFGGFCVNRTDKDVPYGVAADGKVYTMDDKKGVVGYTFVKSLVNSSHGFSLKVGLYIFVNPKAIGEIIPVYQIPMFVYGELKKRYKDISFNAVVDENRMSLHEMSLIEIYMPVYRECDVLELKSKIC